MTWRESKKEIATMNLSIPTAPAVSRRGLRAAWLALAAALVSVALLAVAAVPASAKLVHEFEGNFNGSETPSGSFDYLLALSVDNSTGPSAGDVYIGGSTFSNSGYVYKFTPDGKYANVTFNGAETPTGSFGFFDTSSYRFSRGLAVDNSGGANAGDVYVADASHQVVYRFNEEGEFLCEISGREYASLSTAEQEAECAGATGSKTPQDGFHITEFAFELMGVAVNPVNGDVYVSSPVDNAIDEFNASGEYIGQITDSHVSHPGSIAFNSSGELYVTNGTLFSPESDVKFNASGAYAATLNSNPTDYVAVNPANDKTFLMEGTAFGNSKTVEYDAAGNQLSTFAENESGAIGVGASLGRIYLSPIFSASGVAMYGEGIVVPEVETGEATEIGETTATLNGRAEPDLANGGSSVESCEFEYASKYTLRHIQTVSVSGTERFTLQFTAGGTYASTKWEGEGQVAPESTEVTGIVKVEGSVPVAGDEVSGSGIESGTTVVSYDAEERRMVLSQPTSSTAPEERVRLEAGIPAEASAATVQRALESVKTVGAGNVAVSGPAGGPWQIEFTGAKAEETVSLLGVSQGFSKTKVEEDWAAAGKAPCRPSPPYAFGTDVSAQVSGLTPSMTYEYRLIASDSEGSAAGEYKSFITYGPPRIEREAAEGLTVSAHFWAKINPFGSDTTCLGVEYVTEAEFQRSGWANATTIPCFTEDLGSGFKHAVAGAKVAGLERATVYHYRFLARNQSGPVTGEKNLTERPEGVFETFGVREFQFEVLRSSHEYDPFSNTTTVWEAEEQENPLQAGAHPYEIVTNIDFSRTNVFTKCEQAYICPGGEIGEEMTNGGATALNVKDVKVELPTGLIGNPMAVPKCSYFDNFAVECPTASQVGVLEYQTDYPVNRPEGFEPPAWQEQWEHGCGIYCLVPLYNMEPAGPRPAEFGNPANYNVLIPFEVRTGADYGINSDTVNIDAIVPLSHLRIRLWGTPANPGHAQGRYEGCPRSEAGTCVDREPEVPLLRNPTSCGGPVTAKLSVDTYQEPGKYISKSANAGGVSGCNQLQHFKPTLAALPTTNVADSPSGLNVDLNVPQNVNAEGHEEPNEVATPDLKNAKVVLPKGLALNPASANGLEACTPAEIELHGPNAPTCPDGSKIGRAVVISPLTDHPMDGVVYVAKPHDNPFNSLLAVYVVINDNSTPNGHPTGVIIKLAGHIEADQQTGQLTTTFNENPQLPFSEFKLEFFGGAKGAFRTPATCGKYASESVLTPWSAPESGPPVKGVSPFEILTGPAANGGACSQPNAPAFEAGTETPSAGKYSPFILHLHREDGSQEITSVNATLPPGLSGKLAGVAECSDAAIGAARSKSGAAEQANPSCPANSEVGVVNVASGSGPAPYWTQGHAYLAGPYKGAPLSLAIITPAVAGPYDLGTVVVRAALFVDPVTTQITVKSDQIPTMLDGIPLDVRTLSVKMDRPQFTINPTKCEKMSIGAEAWSALGQEATLTNAFQVGGCSALEFKPKLALLLKGKANRASHPAFTAVVTMPSGDANIASAQVTLPNSELVDQSHMSNVCTRVQFAANQCPANSVYGHARAVTPLLDQPLEGPVYLRSSNHPLPDLVADLNGQIQVVLDGRVDSVHRRLRNTFELVPDAPVSKFVLHMDGGRKGLLQNSTNICAKRYRATAQFIGQNGKVAELRPTVKAKCGGKHHRRGKHHRHHNGKRRR